MGKKRSGNSLMISLVLLILAALFLAAARIVPGFAQWYAVTVYPVLTGSIGRISGIFPFSLAELICIVLPIVLAADIFLCIKRCSSLDRPGMHPLRNFLSHLVIAICILFFIYTVNCGVNYYRESFVDPAAYANAQFTQEELDEFCKFTVDQLQNIYEGSNTSDVSYKSYPDRHELACQAIEAMQHLSDTSSDTADSIYDIDSLKGFYPRPKELTVLSRFFSMMGVSGIYSPFTIEANINGEMAGMEKPFTSCHELSHLKGFMNEGEANYIGWLACINSDNESFNRSGWLIAWIYAGNSLYQTDPDRYQELREKLPDEAIRELDENTDFWASHETKASEVQDQINDAYLKSNGQNQGIRTYGQLTTLMLLWYSK